MYDSSVTGVADRAAHTTARAGFVLVVACVVLAGCGSDDCHTTAIVTATPVATSTGPAATATRSASSPTSAVTHTATAPPTQTPTVAPPTATSTPVDTPTVTPTETPMVANPTVEGPITGPGNFFIQSTSFDVTTLGYSEAEYFVAGTASAYVNVGELGSDGVWSAAPDSSAPFKTRIVVYR